QTDTRDFLAGEIVPALLNVLSQSTLSPADKSARDLLAKWDERMEVASPAATIWWNFWQTYIQETFGPWWQSKKVKVDMAELNDMLGQDLEAWTLYDQNNPAFPHGTARNAGDVMLLAFHKTVNALTKQLGGNPSKWTWGRVHTRVLENLAQVRGLSDGPVPDRGDGYTPLAAPDFPSSHGPSWRMVVDWGAHTFEGVYPGGQSENPASDWYENRAADWFAGRLDPMLTADQAGTTSGTKRWDLRP
ncbi:MAG TPA: penicillin acylase family protein, partial [Candidatus Dormibacteraeota bacterium]|nr:penicillin acylase family protein [Candidatus Dormibacteraeota bacterium]